MRRRHRADDGDVRPAVVSAGQRTDGQCGCRTYVRTVVVAASQEAAVVVVIDGGIGADLRVLKLIPDELDVGHYVDYVNVGNAIHRDRKFWRSLNIAELSTGRPWMGRVQPYGRRLCTL